MIFSARLLGCCSSVRGRSPNPTITSIECTWGISSSDSSSVSGLTASSSKSASVASCSPRSVILRAMPPNTDASRRKGSLVPQPGRAKPNAANTTAVIAIGGVLASICVLKPVPKSESDVAPRVTTIPAAVEIINAGICETNPSPIVRME